MNIVRKIKNAIYSEWQKRTGHDEVPGWVKIVGTGAAMVVGVPVAIVVGQEVLKRVNTPIDELVNGRKDVAPVNARIKRKEDPVDIASEGSFPASDPPNWRG